MVGIGCGGPWNLASGFFFCLKRRVGWLVELFKYEVISKRTK